MTNQKSTRHLPALRRAQGLALRELRLTSGMARSLVADLADLSADTLAEVERGERDPAWTDVLAVLEVLHKEPADLAAARASMLVSSSRDQEVRKETRLHDQGDAREGSEGRE